MTSTSDAQTKTTLTLGYCPCRDWVQQRLQRIDDYGHSITEESGSTSALNTHELCSPACPGWWETALVPPKDYLEWSLKLKEKYGIATPFADISD